MSAVAAEMIPAMKLGAAGLLLKRAADPWAKTRRANQIPPEGDWQTWLVMAGRGFGKTRTGAEWVREEVMSGRSDRVALVGPTAADVRDVMVEGESGLIACCERYGFGAEYQPSRRRVLFANGAVAYLYSADEPQRLRGPQHSGAWSDEVATWRYPEAFDQLQLGLRLGDNPRQIVTGTPRPVKIIKDLLAMVDTGLVALTRGRTYDNAANLAPSFIARIVKRYEGTRLGRQELEGELLTDTPGALWTLESIDADRITDPTLVPELVRIVVAVDPAVSVGEGSSETGIVVGGIDANGDGYILDDLSGSYLPTDWAREAVGAYHRWQADRLVAEINQGGAMVEATVRIIDPNVAYTGVHASVGKRTRAEPVSALFEQHRIHHVGSFPALEDQMTSWVPGMTSPDRMDALVWALTELIVNASFGFELVPDDLAADLAWLGV